MYKQEKTKSKDSNSSSQTVDNILNGLLSRPRFYGLSSTRRLQKHCNFGGSERNREGKRSRAEWEKIIGVFSLTTEAKKCRIYHLDNEQMI